MDEEMARLVDSLEGAHQDVKRAYLAWCPGQNCPEGNGVGSANNAKTQQFFETNPAVLGPINNIKNRIITALDGLDRKQAYDILREVYFVHPSFHEAWWIHKHFEHDRASVLHHSRFGLDKLTGWIDTPNSSRIQGSATFLTRYTLLLENLLSPGLTTSLFDVPADEEALRSNVRDVVGTWDALSITGVAREMPVLFSIIHTLLEKTRYRSLDPRSLLDIGRWHIAWAQCSVNEGPLLNKTSDLSRREIFRSLPTLDDQEAIRSYLRRHYAVSCDEYLQVLAGAAPSNPAREEPFEEEPAPSKSRHRSKVSGEEPRPDITEMIERWRDSWGYIRFPDQGVTLGGRQYVAFYYSWEGKKIQYDLASIHKDTTISIELENRAKKPTIIPREMRVEVISRLNRALDLSLSETMVENPKVSLAVLGSPGRFTAFTGILDWMMAEIRKNEPGR